MLKLLGKAVVVLAARSGGSKHNDVVMARVRTAVILSDILLFCGC